MVSKVLAGLALVSLACTGQVGQSPRGTDPNGGGEPPGGRGNTGATGGGKVTGTGGSNGGGTTPSDQPGAAIFRRLSRTEYNNTVRDLLGDNSQPANVFPPDTDSYKSGFLRGGAIAAVDAGRLLEVTERLAGEAVKARLGMLLPCNPIPTAAADQDRCAQQFITQFGRRAFRRPLATDEAKALGDHYTQMRALPGQDFPGAIRMVIAAMLMSPNFLYRWELAPKAAVKEGSLLRFNGYETASRLSYLFWASMPDDALLNAAEQNRLSSPDHLDAEARRLLKDPRARDAVADFFQQWLDVTQLADLVKNTGLFTNYTPELAQSMMAETREFAANLVTKGDARLETLLTSTSTFLDARLAGLYKVSGGGATLAPAMLDPGQRGGILTQASFLAAHGTSEESHPVKRGKTLADRLLCIDLPLPPDNVPDPKMPAPNLSTRERYAEHGKEACAMACHAILDPLGFAFEHYDAIGGWRAMDGGKPVDATGTLELGGQQKSFRNAMELSALLAQAPEVRECMARQWLRFALRRHENPGDTASVVAALEAFGKSGYDLRELMVALTKTRAFTHRVASMGEVLP
jgi:hypothetical protein